MARTRKRVPAKPPAARARHSAAAHLHDADRHVAIALLTAALALFVAAVAAGAVGTVWQPGVKYEGSLPLLWFDAILRRAGPLLPAPLLAARAAAHGGLGGARGSARPRGHFVQAACVYAAAAAVRLGVYVPHRSGLLTRAVDGLKHAAATAAAAARGEAAALARAARPARSAGAAADHHLMSDHVFLGACLSTLLAAEGVFLVADIRRGGHGRARVALLKTGLFLCAALFLLLAADMHYTAAYFHAQHESWAALAAGGVAFAGPVAWWLLRQR